jgi:hypothetical protein
MNSTVRHSDTCSVICLSNKKEVEAEVLDFKENKYLNVVINKSVKIPLIWNGKIYEGRAAGMDFESKGPKISRSQTALRG